MWKERKETQLTLDSYIIDLQKSFKLIEVFRDQPNCETQINMLSQE